MYKEKIVEIKNELKDLFNNIKDKQTLENIKVEYMGKNGKITLLNGQIKEVPNEEKKEFGMAVNEIRNEFNEKYEKIKNDLEEAEINQKLASEAIDVTLPGTKIKNGAPNI